MNPAPRNDHAAHHDLDAEVAASLDATPELLPLLPELLADLDELGGGLDEVLRLIDSTGLAPAATAPAPRAIDLGCGKGVCALALARRGFSVLGIDGFAPFIEEARRQAALQNLTHRCAFHTGDLRDALSSNPAGFDLATLLSVGPFAGNHAATIAAIRPAVRPRGFIIIADAFANPAARHPGNVGERAGGDFTAYAPRDKTRAMLESRGDRIEAEIIDDPAESRAVDLRLTDLIRRRAEAIAARSPQRADIVMAYVAEQERQTELLATSLTGATWLVRRAE